MHEDAMLCLTYGRSLCGLREPDCDGIMDGCIYGSLIINVIININYALKMSILHSLGELPIVSFNMICNMQYENEGRKERK